MRRVLAEWPNDDAVACVARRGLLESRYRADGNQHIPPSRTRSASKVPRLIANPSTALLSVLTNAAGIGQDFLVLAR
jgi:hypothetical protein